MTWPLVSEGSPALPLEDVRMTAHELVADRVDGVADREVAGLLADPRQEHRLEQEVAELLAEMRRLAALDRLEHLVGLLEHERTQRRVRLLAVPRAPVRRAQRAHDLDQTLESLAHTVDHGDMLPFEIVQVERMSDGGHHSTSKHDHDAAVTFVGFVLSLAHTAAFHFGDVPDPVTGEPARPTSPAAQQMIDILALLEEKTRGNLTAEERQLLEQILYELRMRYVEASKTAANQPPSPRASSSLIRHPIPSRDRAVPRHRHFSRHRTTACR